MHICIDIQNDIMSTILSYNWSSFMEFNCITVFTFKFLIMIIYYTKFAAIYALSYMKI